MKDELEHVRKICEKNTDAVLWKLHDSLFPKKQHTKGIYRCEARTSNGNRCIRTTNDDTKLCLCHKKDLKYGRIMEKPTSVYYNMIIQNKKCINIDNIHKTNVDIKNFVKMKFVVINDTEYLLDEEKKIYKLERKHDFYVTCVGKITNQGIEWINQ